MALGVFVGSVMHGMADTRTKLSLRRRFLRAEVRWTHARMSAHALFWSSLGAMTVERHPRWVLAYMVGVLVGWLGILRYTGKAKRVSRAIAQRWGLACFNGTDQFRMRYRGETAALRESIVRIVLNAVNRQARRSQDSQRELPSK